MRSGRARKVLVVIVTVAAVVPWRATPAVAFVEGSDNNFFGTNPPTNTGNGNSFFGGDAGTSNTSGSGNSFFGRAAGLNNDAGGSNSFFGRGAGANNETGSRNSFFGLAAGDSNTASDNAFFGHEAGRDNTTGESNAFFGLSAGAFNTTGGSNAFFGRDAGRSNLAACCNAFFGRNAGVNNNTGERNAFFGMSVTSDNTAGSDNAFFGFNAGENNTTGSNNAFFGRSTGFSNTTENANTFLGTFSDGAAGITNATAVGHLAQVRQSDSLVLGSIAGENGATQSVRVGIGTATPTGPLHVRRADGTAKVLVEEASDTPLGRELFQLTNNGAARFRLRNTANGATWDFQSSSGPGSFVIDRVGGPSTLDFELQPDGDLVLKGTVSATSFITSSDRTKKTDITPVNASKLMSLLRQLDISTWRFKNQAKHTVNLGPMAQDFHRLFGMGTQTTIDIRDLAALALVAAQAQQKQIDDLQSVVAELSTGR